MNLEYPTDCAWTRLQYVFVSYLFRIMKAGYDGPVLWQSAPTLRGCANTAYSSSETLSCKGHLAVPMNNGVQFVLALVLRQHPTVLLT